MRVMIRSVSHKNSKCSIPSFTPLNPQILKSQPSGDTHGNHYIRYCCWGSPLPIDSRSILGNNLNHDLWCSPILKQSEGCRLPIPNPGSLFPSRPHHPSPSLSAVNPPFWLRDLLWRSERNAKVLYQVASADLIVPSISRLHLFLLLRESSCAEMNSSSGSAAGPSSGSGDGSAPRRNSKRPKCNLTSEILFFPSFPCGFAVV